MESVFGKGTTFHFHIILKPSKVTLKLVDEIDLAGMPVLIVDDNKTNLEILKAQLEAWGAIVTTAISGELALRACEKAYDEGTVFPIALLDMQMPEMDGMMLSKEIQTHPNWKGMHLVLLTSLGHEDPASLKESGFSAYFTKPISVSDLDLALRLILSDASEDTLLTKHHTHSKLENVFSTSKSFVDKHILIVEDNEINQLIIEGLLEPLDMHIEMASDGRQAIDFLKDPSNAPVDLLLMDCQMPILDGYEATRLIRNGEAGDHYINVPIVAMTANAMQGDREKCLDSGMNDYLTKPIDLIALENCLAAHLKVSIAIHD